MPPQNNQPNQPIQPVPPAREAVRPTEVATNPVVVPEQAPAPAVPAEQVAPIVQTPEEQTVATPENLTPTSPEAVTPVMPEAQPQTQTPEAPSQDAAKLQALRGGLTAPVAPDLKAEETEIAEKAGSELNKDATNLVKMEMAFRDQETDNSNLNKTYADEQAAVLKKLGIELKDVA
jgi:hypothetical protein